jgi:ubiquinone/menaquinone biosynthesis C-methylase UbiE
VTEARIGKEYYDRSDYFEGDTEHLTDLASPFQRYRISKVLEIYRPNSQDRVLDLGCGWGTFCFALAPQVREVVGLDFSEKSIELCNRELESAPRTNVRFVCADAGDTGLPAGSFDVIIAADLLEHLYPEDSQRVFQEAYRLLGPGGRLVVWTPHRGHLLEILKNHDILLERDVSHVDYKSMDRLVGYAEAAGFAIERAYYAESHVPGLRGLERLLQRWIPLLRRRIAVLARKP